MNRHKLALIAFVVGTVVSTASAQNLLTNGDFESGPVGTDRLITGNPPNVRGEIDTKTFDGWRFFNIGDPPNKSFRGTIVNVDGSGGSASGRAMRLETDMTGDGVEADSGLDIDSNKVPVAQGTRYTLSFDAKLESFEPDTSYGNIIFLVAIAEFDVGGNFLGRQISSQPVLPSDKTFDHYTVDFVAESPDTAQVVISFRPRCQGSACAVVIDNVSFVANP